WGRPQQALELQEDDLHAQRAHALDTVLDAVAPVECVLAPPIPRRPWRLAVRSEDGPAVRRALSALPVHWELHREAGGRRLTVRPRLAADGRPLEPVPDLDVVLDVLPFDGARYGDASTAALPHVGAQEWSETSRESRPGALDADRRRLHLGGRLRSGVAPTAGRGAAGRLGRPVRVPPIGRGREPLSGLRGAALLPALPPALRDLGAADPPPHRR